MNKRHLPRSRQRGAIFVVTLGILVVLVAIVASVAATERLAIKAETNRMEQHRAKLVAEAGIQRAVEALADANQSGSTTNTSSNATQGSVNLPGSTTLQDDWASLGTQGSDRFVLSDGSFRMQIVDAASRINLNTATQAQLQNLPLTQEQVDSILDWRTAGENARSDGAKDDYYNNLQNPYDASLHGFSEVSELLDVRYFNPVDLYDPPTIQNSSSAQVDFPDGRTPTLAELLTTDSTCPQVNQAGTTKPLISSPQARAILMRIVPPVQGGGPNPRLAAMQRATTWQAVIQADPPMTAAQLRTLLNGVAVGSTTGAGKINLNTAPQAVLQALPNITPDVAQAIVTQQQTGFTQLGDILSVPGLGTVRSVQNIIDSFAVKSSTFIVRVIGTAGFTQVPLEAIVTVQTGTAGGTATTTVKIQRMEEQPFNDMTGRWGWQSTTSNDINLEAGS